MSEDSFQRANTKSKKKISSKKLVQTVCRENGVIENFAPLGLVCEKVKSLSSTNIRIYLSMVSFECSFLTFSFTLGGGEGVKWLRRALHLRKIALKNLLSTKHHNDSSHGDYWAGTHFQEIFLHENSLTRTALHEWLFAQK